MVAFWSIIAIIAMIGCIVYPLLRKNSAAIIITIGLVIVFMIELVDIWTSPLRNNSILTDLAFSPRYLLTGESLYTVFTSVFLHAGFDHILFNAFSLVFIGMMLEDRIGSKKFILIFVLTGIIGTLTYGIANFGQTGLVVGASGAISGLLGALLVLYPREKTNFIIFPLPLRNTPMWIIVLIFIALQMLFVLLPRSNVAWQSHVGGLVAGMIFAPIIMKLKEREHILPGESIDIRKLANTQKEKEIVGRINTETIPEIRDAWLEQLSQTVKCPSCGAKMKAYQGGLRCLNGHRYRIEK